MTKEQRKKPYQRSVERVVSTDQMSSAWHPCKRHALTSRQVERYFGHKPIYEQIQFNCGMAAISIARGREEKDKARKAEHFSAATMALNNSKRLNDQEQLVYLGYGLLAVAKVQEIFGMAVPTLCLPWLHL